MANQTQKFMGALVEHMPVDALSTADRQYWIRNGTELAEVLANALKRTALTVAVTSTLLTTFATVPLPATTEPFGAREKFVVNTSADAEVKISFISENFTNWFLADGGKVEPAQAERGLRYAKLKKSLRYELIITELGGEAKAETSLADIWSLLKKQAHGGEGALLTNGYANIFYIRDRSSVLRTVCVGWYGRGWRVAAYSVERPNDWYAHSQVFSCN